MVSPFCFSDGSLPGGPQGRPEELEEVHYGTAASNHFHPPWFIHHSLTGHSLIYLLIQQMFIKYTFCAKSSARLWGIDVASGAHLANQTTCFVARISLPSSVPLFTLPSDCPSHTPSSGLCQGFGVCCSSSPGPHRTGAFSSCSSKTSHCVLGGLITPNSLASICLALCCLLPSL